MILIMINPTLVIAAPHLCKTSSILSLFFVFLLRIPKRQQRAEGRREQLVGASDPLPIASHQISILVGVLNPCSLRSPEALRQRLQPTPQALDLLPFMIKVSERISQRYFLQTVIKKRLSSKK